MSDNVDRERISALTKRIEPGKAERKHNGSVAPAVTGPVTNEDQEAINKRANLALELAQEPPGAGPKTGRNTELNNVSLQLGHYGAAGRLDKEKTRALLRQACVSNGYIDDPDGGEAAFNATFESGWNEGLKEPRASVAPDGEDDDGNGKRKSQADTLIEISAAAQLFFAPDNRRYADVPVEGHVETWEIDSSGFREWLIGMYYDMTGKGPSGEAIKTALDTIRVQAKSRKDGAVERAVHLRVAEHDGRLYIDLCDAGWRAIEVDYTGWRLVERPPCRFTRTPGMLPLPEPVRGGSVDDLRPFLRAEGDNFVLSIAWELGALRGGASEYPPLVYSGAADSGKSTQANFLRQLIDPNAVIDQGAPKSVDDLLVTAESEHVVALDNLSTIPPDLSDVICRLSNGGGRKKRALYTDNGVHAFTGVRPLMLTSTLDVLTRGDASSRSLLVYFDSIPKSQRVAIEELKASFAKAAPGVLGALLDAMVCGLRTMLTWRLAGNGPKESVLRLASFEKWVIACEGALPWPAGTLRRAFETNERRRLDMLVEVEPVIGALNKLLDGGDIGDALDPSRPKVWEGSATQLLEDINRLVEGRVRQAEGWPRQPHILSARLTEKAEALKQLGITIERRRKQDPVTKQNIGPKLLRITKTDV